MRGPKYNILDQVFEKKTGAKKNCIPNFAKSFLIGFGGYDSTFLTNSFCDFILLNYEVFKNQSFNILLEFLIL